MPLYQEYREDVMERLRNESDSKFAGIGRTRADIMADKSTVDDMWARFQKDIEDGVDPADAWEDTLFEVLGINPPSRDQQKLKDALGKINTKGVFNCTDATDVITLAVILEYFAIDEMTLAEWDKWKAIANIITEEMMNDAEPRFSLYDYLTALANEGSADAMLRMAEEDKHAFYNHAVELAAYKR